jgi:hypothetical protein
MENGTRTQLLLKVRQAYKAYRTMARFYGIDTLVRQAMEEGVQTIEAWKNFLPKQTKRQQWINVGGQLIPEKPFHSFRQDIHKGKIKNWGDIHRFYTRQAEEYARYTREHAMAVLAELGTPFKTLQDPARLSLLAKELADTKNAIVEGIHSSRKKDYENPFRKMLYENDDEMNRVIGTLEDNSFIRDQQAELKSFQAGIRQWIKKMKG